MTQIPVRERVVAQIVRKFKNMNFDNQGDYNGVNFQFVEREELNRTQQYRGNAISVLDMDESYVYQTCYLQCTLRVGFEFWHKMSIGAVASTNLGIVLAEIKRVMLSDCNLIEDETGVQLTENIRIVSVDYDLDGNDSKTVSGFIQFDVIYRTNKEDPYVLM